MCYLDLCIQLFFLSKDHVKSLSEQNLKKINIKNIKMKPPVALFKKKNGKLCLFLKAKSQYLINTVVRCLHKEKDVKNVICKTRNHPQISQTTHKSTKLPTTHPNHPQSIHKPATSQPNYPQTT